MVMIQQSRAAAPPRQPRLTLASVTSRANTGPLRLLVHGVEGVGKTTFAAAAPSPILVCPEAGIPATAGAVPHFGEPDGGWTWADIIDAVRVVAAGGHDYRTLVLDTVDWIEPLLWADVVARDGKATTIEEVGGGYGKGYTAALDGWRSLVAELELARRAGVNVILLAHTWIRPFRDPESDGYDRYELKINNKAAGLLKEWCDAVLFARHEDVAHKDSKTKRVRGVSTGARVVHTVHAAAYDAKNRYGLPDVLPLDWATFADAVKAGHPAAAGDLRAAIIEAIEQLDESDAEKARGAVERAGDDATKLAHLDNWVRTRIGGGR